MGKQLTLFTKLPRGAIFHYYFTPQEKLVKIDESHALGLSGRRYTHPHVLIVEDKDTPKISRPKGQEK